MMIVLRGASPVGVNTRGSSQGCEGSTLICLVIVMGEATPEEKIRARTQGLYKKQSILVLVVGGTMVS